MSTLPLTPHPTAHSSPVTGTTPRPRPRLTRPDLVERLSGVEQELRASLHRGEITEEQKQQFLRRMEQRLLREQDGEIPGEEPATRWG